MFRNSMVSQARAVTGVFLFTKNKFAEHQAAILKKNPELPKRDIFHKTKSSVYAAWKELSTKDRIAQGYYQEVDAATLEKMKEASKAKYAKKSDTKKSDGELSGQYLFTKHKYPEHKEKVLKKNPELTGNALFQKVKESVLAVWSKMSQEDRVAQGYGAKETAVSKKDSKSSSSKFSGKSKFSRFNGKSKFSGFSGTKSPKSSDNKKTEKRVSTGKPLSGYFKFNKEKGPAVHAAIAKEYPNLTKQEKFLKAGKKMSAMWKELTTQQRVAQGYAMKKSE